MKYFLEKTHIGTKYIWKEVGDNLMTLIAVREKHYKDWHAYKELFYREVPIQFHNAVATVKELTEQEVFTELL